MNSQPIKDCILVIFGAGGDLTKRKLLPSLFNLSKAGLLPEHFALIGTAREAITTSVFRERMAHELKARLSPEAFDSKLASDLISRIHYVHGDFSKESSHAGLVSAIEKIRKQQHVPANLLFYLAVPPDLFIEIPRHLASHGLLDQSDGSWKRVVIEKPFGRDLESARALNRELSKVMTEDQIYRIDHYLGKETVQNIMALRFANGILEPIWNHKYIDSVQITVAETLGVESRGGYYDTAGALRDMVPNHLFQLISLIGMEPPISFDAKDVRDEKVKLLRSIKPLSPEDVLTHAVRGQYSGYRQEPKVDPSSKTETLTALKLEIDNWRWSGVPFYLRTGKKMAERVTEATILFKCAPFQLFSEHDAACSFPNILTLQIQPVEQIQLQMAGKIPGPGMHLGSYPLCFNYVEAFGGNPQTGYETLLHDCMKGDPTLFQRADQIEAGWKVVAPIQDVWQALQPRDFPNYAAGSWGPQAASDLLAKDGRQWFIAPPSVSGRKAVAGPAAKTPEVKAA